MGGVKVTGWIDQGLNEKAYIIPGLGDFGERRYVGNIESGSWDGSAYDWGLAGIVHEGRTA